MPSLLYDSLSGLLAVDTALNYRHLLLSAALGDSRLLSGTTAIDKILGMDGLVLNGDIASDTGVDEWQEDLNTDGSLNKILASIADIKTEAASGSPSGLTYDEVLENARIWAEGTDEEVAALGGVHSAKTWAEIFQAQQYIINLEACSDLSVVYDSTTGKTKIMWKDPEDRKTSSTVFCEWAKTELWRSIGDVPPEYPGAPGSLLVTSTDLAGDSHPRDYYAYNAFEESILVPGQTYSYKLFSYNTAGSYNNLDANALPHVTQFTWPMLHQLSQAGTLSAYCEIRTDLHLAA